MPNKDDPLNVNVQTRPLTDLYQDPANARQHPERNLKAIKASLREYGQVEPLIVRENGKVIGGNARLECMENLDWTEAQVVEFNGTEAEATKLALTLNRTADTATWDKETLGQELDALVKEDIQVDPLWDEDELDELLGPGDAEPGNPEDLGLESTYELVITCDDEEHQQELYNRLTEEGLECRIVSM